MNIRKIAELTNLSIATISRVLKGDQNVDPSTRDLVLRELSQHPFYPDLKKKKTKKPNLFVFLSPLHVNNQLNTTQINFFSRSLAGIKSYFDATNVLDDHERYLILASFKSGHISEKLSELEKLGSAGTIGGLFIIHTQKQDHAELARYEGNLKIYLLGRSREDVPNDRIDFINYNDEKAGRLAYEHLVSMGHRNILVFSGPPEFSYFEKRERAFFQNMNRKENKIEFVHTDQNSPESAEKYVKMYFGKKKSKITAIYVTSEVLLEGVLHYLDQKGIKVPADLSLMSTNDYLIAYQHNPPITVIRTPQFEIGRIAAVIAIENNRFDFGTRVDYELDVMLNERQSVRKIRKSANPHRGLP